MKSELEAKLKSIAKEEIDNDVSHDYYHAKRVLRNSKEIANSEGGDLDVIVPAALFHDLIVHPKDSEESKDEHVQSARKAESILKSIDDYPNDKIGNVSDVIKKCSFSKNIDKDSIEEKIVQDADLLEATGTISIMRTFASVETMDKKFYHPDEIIPENRKPEPKEYGLDLFFTRLFKVKERIHTETAREMADRRVAFLKRFVAQLNRELEQ